MPLDLEEDGFRLCRFADSHGCNAHKQSLDSPIISLSMEHFALRTNPNGKRQTPEYTAVSYTWGPPEPVQMVSINGYSLSIRQNLYEFLVELVA